MDQDSDFDRQRQIAAWVQTNFTATTDCLSRTVTLTNCISKGPTLREEAIWMSEIVSQWWRTLDSLKMVFYERSFQDARIHEIFQQCMLKLVDYSQEPSEAQLYGTTIKEFAEMLKNYLQNHHSWHDPGTVQCTCCQHPKMHGLQQAIIYQLDVLCNVAIPWTYILHGRYYYR